MEELSLSDFDRAFPHQPIAYTSGEFNGLNASKAESVKALALRENGGELVAGQIFGLRGGEWRAPFSAPFSCLAGSHIYNNVYYAEARNALGGSIRLVLPPEIYGAAPSPHNAEVVYEDANYHYPLEQFADYEAHLSRAGKYNHHRALKHIFEFFKTDDVARAYGVIAENRRAMGYPLAMSLKQVEETIKIIPADFFVMQLEGKDVAAAMIYQAAPGIMQVIYWGDLPEGRYARSMNRLAWEVFGWYSRNRPEISIIDIGPASSEGILNDGLVQFKESIGCVRSSKLTVKI